MALFPSQPARAAMAAFAAGVGFQAQTGEPTTTRSKGETSIIGDVGGDGLRIRCGTQRLTIGPEEMEHALSSLTRVMRT